MMIAIEGIIAMSVSGREFHLGLTMSGAISAGAYTAGVFDFLIQALDEWEKVRDGGKSVPDHRVGLKVMAGASAGSITAAIGALALLDGDQQPGFHRNETGTAFHYYLPKLYDAWVVKPAFQDEGAIGLDLLSLGDLDKPIDPTVPPGSLLRSQDAPIPTASDDSAPVASLLNVSILAKIAEDALNVSTPLSPPKAYIAETLHIYMTLTNLRGVPYKVPFNGGDYHMITHGDRTHYAIANAGGWHKPGSESAFGESDAARPLEPRWLLPVSTRPTSPNGGISQSARWPLRLSPSGCRHALSAATSAIMWAAIFQVPHLSQTLTPLNQNGRQLGRRTRRSTSQPPTGASSTTTHSNMRISL